MLLTQRSPGQRALGHLALAVLATAAPALAQNTVPLFRSFDPVGESPSAESIQPHPGGGVVTITNDRDAMGTYVLTLRRIAESGEVLWSYEPTAPPSAALPDSVEVTPDGDTILLRGFALTALDPAGTVLWELDLSSLAPASYFFQLTGLTDDGDILLISNTTAATNAVVAHRLDSDTGTVQWTVQLASDASPWPTRLRGTVAGGDLFVAFANFPTFSAARISAAGQVLYYRPDLGVSSNAVTRPVEAIAATETGVLYAALNSGPTQRLLALDALGNILWNQPPSDGSTIQGAVVLDNGDLVLTRSAGGGYLERIDAAGNTVWLRSGPPTTWSYSNLAVRPGGGFYVSSFVQTPGTVGVRAVLVRTDSNGQPVETIDLEPTRNSPIGSVALSCRVTAPDSRGNVWVHYASWAREISSSTTGTTVAAVIEDRVAEGPVCAQSTPNSTAQLGQLAALGSGAAASDNLTLFASRLPSSVPVLFLNATASGFVAHPGGSEGDLCLGGSIARYARPGEIRTTDNRGRAALTLDLDDTPSGAGSTAVLAGDTLYFQAWHRDTDTAGAPSSNLTSAFSVTFQ